MDNSMLTLIEIIGAFKNQNFLKRQIATEKFQNKRRKVNL